METVLQMLKTDLGINHTLRDDYFNNLIKSCENELASKAITLDLEMPDDMMLLSDYSAWIYRKRAENVPMAQNLVLRIRNRQVKGRASLA